MRSMVIFCSLVMGLSPICCAWTGAARARPIAAAKVALANERFIWGSPSWVVPRSRAVTALTGLAPESLQRLAVRFGSASWSYGGRPRRRSDQPSTRRIRAGDARIQRGPLSLCLLALPRPPCGGGPGTGGLSAWLEIVGRSEGARAGKGLADDDREKRICAQPSAQAQPHESGGRPRGRAPLHTLVRRGPRNRAARGDAAAHLPRAAAPPGDRRIHLRGDRRHAWHERGRGDDAPYARAPGASPAVH